MNAIFSSPLMFIALSALPALAAVYLLRNRFRVHKVSSLMLWSDHSSPSQGGRHISRIQTPLLFILELFTLLMLILAAAGPMIRSSKDTRLFVIVLDDSYSMLAGETSSPRQRAQEKIKELLSEPGLFQARFILAKRNPELLGQPVKSIFQLNDLLSQWQCSSPAADLGSALSLANQLASKASRILVITDHKPDIDPQSGHIEWWAFGKSLPNIAFVSAGRNPFQESDRCLLAVANLSDQPASTELTVTAIDETQTLIKKTIQLMPRQVYRSFFNTDPAAGPLLASLRSDSLNIDNQVFLVSQPAKPLRVHLDIKQPDLLNSVKKAVQSVKNTRLSSLHPHLKITDQPSANSGLPQDCWTLNIFSDPNSASYLGPFVVDFSHPLTDGVSLAGVIWAAAKTDRLIGNPVITAGNIPLVCDYETFSGSHNVTLNFNPQLSTLSQSPNWPIMIWNLVQWRKSFLPGLDESNILLGNSATFTKNPLEDGTLILIDPQNNSRDISSQNKTLLIKPDSPGLYKIKTQTDQHDLAVNAMAKSESDISAAQTGKWGHWDQASLFWWEYRQVDWILLLISLALLTAHRLLTAHQQKGRLL